MRTALYLLLYLLALAPGVPIGIRIFGGSPLGWVAGAVVGHALAAVAFWVPAFLGWAHPAAFLGIWLLLALLVVRWWRRRQPDAPPLVPLPRWTPADTRRWLVAIALVCVVVGWPFSRVGEADSEGVTRYRAYFTADFVWHMAMTQELARFEFPPTNPYLAPAPIHYYWTYFMVPAVLAGPSHVPVVSVERALLVTAFGTALLMFSAVFLAAWAVTGRSSAALGASLLALLAPSWEGLYTVYEFWVRGTPWDQIVAAWRETNIDAITNWRFQGLRIDGLVRSMWWTPQHALSFTLGLIAMVAVGVRPASSWKRAAASGLLLGFSVAVNPFLGAAFCVIHGLIVLIQIARRSAPIATLGQQAATVGPVLVALGWTTVNQMAGNAGDALTIGWGGLGANAPVLTLVLSLGGLLLPAAWAIVPSRRAPIGDAWIGWVGFVVALWLAWFVSLTDRAWVGFRAGNIFQITLPMLVAVGLTRLERIGRHVVTVTVALLLLAGLPTTLIDAFNAQDLENRTMGPGFRWTIPLSLDQQAGFRWLRESTPVDAVVQADPVRRGRDQWSAVPSFGGRRMAAGLPISLIHVPEYDMRSQQAHDLLTGADPQVLHAQARMLGITHIWLDEEDPGDIAARLLTRPDLFGLLFHRGAVHVFGLHPIAGVLPGTP
ncbi:MAG: hypothetical protein FJW21_05485 [Acidimicrobiia bacterium]|nr:hypothetical protein [Acidimicrobiia bacterium]